MKRVLKALSGFGALHALNAVVNMSYTFLQLYVFARTLPQDRYSEVVFLTSVGFFVLPLSQAIGRANYVSLRPKVVGKQASGRHDEITLLIYAQSVVLTAVALVVPLFTGETPALYLEDVFYLVFCLFTNFWYYELQSTVWAIDLGKEFEKLSFVRRMTNFLALGLMLLLQNFLVFCALTFVTNVVYFVMLVRMMVARGSIVPPFPRPSQITRAAFKEHGLHFLTSLMSTISELVILNAPYGLLTYMFGIGPAVVVYDTVMKLARLSMMFARNLSEIALPRISRLALNGQGGNAKQVHNLVLLLCVGASLGLAGVIWLFSSTIFSVLLGPNNVMPPEAGYLAAIVVLFSGLYQPSTFFLSFLNAKKSIQIVTIAALVGFAAYAGILLIVQPGVVATIGAYSIYFAGLTLLMTVLAEGAIRHGAKS